MLAGDHIEAFCLSAVPAPAVYVGTECAGTFGRYRYRFPIHEPLARALVEAGIERGFDLVYTQDAPLDYAFYVPLHFTMPEPSVPLVPLLQRLPAAPADAQALLRVGTGPRRDSGLALGAGGSHGLGRHVPLPGDGPLRVAGVRLRPAAAGPLERGAEPRAGRGHGRGAGPCRQHRAADVDHVARRGRRREGRRLLLRAVVASRQRGRGVAASSADLRLSRGWGPAVRGEPII